MLVERLSVSTGTLKNKKEELNSVVLGISVYAYLLQHI